MKNLQNIFAIALLAGSAAVYAQGANQSAFTAGGRQVLNVNNKPASIAGSMYTDENFLPAKLSTNTTTVLLRYNAYSDYFEMSNPQEGVTKALPKQAGVVTFNTNGQQYDYLTYHKNDDEISGYLSVISDNPKVKIYKRERVYLQEGSKSDNGYAVAKPSTYKRAKDEFYAQIADGPVVYFSNKKAFGKLFGEKNKQVTDYIKQNSLDLEKTEDLQKLANFSATLL
jgi:hypothetical protein